MLSIWQSVTRTYIYILLTSGGLVVKYVPTMQEIPYKVGDLGSIPESEDPLEKEMATHFSILARKIPWKRSLEGYSQWGHKSRI